MCVIDWVLIFELIKSLSVIVLSTVAIYGVNSWRKETKWKKKYELAEETLSLFYEVQDAISIIRNPFGHYSEGKTRKRNKIENEDDSEILDQAYVVIERFENNKDPFYKLRAIKYRFKTQFGKESEQYFNDIVTLTNRIMAASRSLGKIYWKKHDGKRFTSKEDEGTIEKMSKYESIIWEDNGENGDEIKQELEHIIAGIENICNSILGKKNNNN